jgi:hypothetical protein
MDPWQPRTLRTDVAEMKEGPEDWSHQVDGVPSSQKGGGKPKGAGKTDL